MKKKKNGVIVFFVRWKKLYNAFEKYDCKPS